MTEAPFSNRSVGPKLSMTTYAPLMNIQIAPAMQINKISLRLRRAVGVKEAFILVGASR